MVGPIFDFPSTRILEKSIEDGIAQGIEKGIRITALKMIAAKASDDIISEYTGLTLDEITELKESVNNEA